MRIKLNYIAPLLATGAAAVAIVAAPTAAAQSCDYVGGGFTDSQCQSPGNVQINDAPPPITSSSMGTYGPFFSYDRGRR